jgi:Cu(I)/Ag(I) efflux system membrane fusion protein
MKHLYLLLITAILFLNQPTLAQDQALYTCPMHPHYISTDPNGTCPICGMDLVPSKSESNSAPTNPLLGTVISVPSEMIQTMGVKTEHVKQVAFGRKVRAFGNVQANTRREVVSASRLEGWIEDLAVTAEGDTVRPGQLLYRVYSPDLVAAQKDYLAAIKIGNDNRINASEQRLRSLGMQRAAITSLKSQQKLIEKIPVFAEDGGVVQALEVRDGAYVKPGDAVLKLQSYADVWVIASIVEQDIIFVSSGIPVMLEFPSAPQAPQHGIVDYVYPTIDPVTRTLKVRIVVDNEQGYLRPGAFADIAFNVDAGEKLSVPSEAVLHDSSGAHVITALGEGRFSSRAIRTGISADGRTEITSGLEAGESVIVSGQFMLDSETNLREGFAKLTPPIVNPDTQLSALALDLNALALIDHFIDAALYFHEAIVDKYEIDTQYLNPAISAGETLKARFANTQLIPIVEAMQSVLANTQDTKKPVPLAQSLSELVLAAKPWLLEGAPKHYQDKEISLYQDVETGRFFLQENVQSGVLKGLSISNPYSNGEVHSIAWPMQMDQHNMQSVPAPKDSPARASDPHAAHH